MKIPPDTFQRRDFREWALVHLIAKFGLIEKGAVLPLPEPIDVTMTINGTEVNFFAVVDELERQHDRMVREEAQKLFDDRCAEVMEPLVTAQIQAADIIAINKIDKADKDEIALVTERIKKIAEQKKVFAISAENKINFEHLLVELI